QEGRDPARAHGRGGFQEDGDRLHREAVWSGERRDEDGRGVGGTAIYGGQAEVSPRSAHYNTELASYRDRRLVSLLRYLWPSCFTSTRRLVLDYGECRRPAAIPVDADGPAQSAAERHVS